MALTYAARTAQRILTLQPSLQAFAREHVRRVREELGLDLYITEAQRSPERQTELQSQSTAEKLLTKAKAWFSWHQYGLAYDVTVAGKTPDQVPSATWERIGTIGEALGLEWGGRWRSPDKPHFEWHPGFTIRAAYDYLQQTGKIPTITVTLSAAGIAFILGMLYFLWRVVKGRMP